MLFCSFRAEAATISNLRLGDTETNVRLVFELNEKVDYSIKWQGDDVVLSLPHSNLADFTFPATKGNWLKKVDFQQNGDNLDFIIDLPLKTDYKAFYLKEPTRLVIDIYKQYELKEEKDIQDGIKLHTLKKYSNTGNLPLFVLDIDKAKFKVKEVLAGGNISSGRRPLTQIIRDENALAGVNAGYFALDGSLIGVSRIDCVTAGTTHFTRSGVGFYPNGEIKMGLVSYSGLVNLNNIECEVSGVNIARPADSLILYNRLYGTTTGTNAYGTEYTIIEDKVTNITKGNSTIPQNGVVVSVHGKAEAVFKDIKVGDTAIIGEYLTGSIADAPNITGCSPRLLTDGKITVTADEEELEANVKNGRAPRTAIGVKKDGNILLMVVDGRRTASQGATLTELAKLMQDYGAYNAMNLDGGGSSEMVVNNKIVNVPSENVERKVASAIIVTR